MIEPPRDQLVKLDWDKVSFYVGELTLQSENTLLMKDLKSEQKPLQDEVFSLLKALQNTQHLLNRPVVSKSILVDREKLLAIDIPFKTNEIISKYKLIRELGSGAFAKVFLAEDTQLERLVALKISTLKCEEAQVLAQINHPNIVTVFECFDQIRNATPYYMIAMSYVKGLHLDEFLVNRPQVNRMELFNKLVSGLGEAHRLGILHLDLKPNNILVDAAGEPHLMDFNIAMRKSGRPVGGTSNYMSPEHFKALYSSEPIPLDARSDIYSIGMVFLPLAKNELFRALLATCVFKAPDKRWSSAAHLQKTVKQLLDQIKITQSLPLEGSWIKKLQRHPIASAFLFALLPQFIGSFFNITYNQIFIVNSLSPVQISKFENLVLIYNVIAYSTCGSLAFRKLQKIQHRYENLATAVDSSHDYLLKQKQRGQLLLSLKKLNFDFFKLMILGWLPGIAFFPYLLNWGQPIDLWLVTHFSISIISSWVMASSFSYLALNSWFFRVALPNLLEVEDLKLLLPIETDRRHWVCNLLGSTPLLLLLASSLSIQILRIELVENAIILHSILAILALIGINFSFTNIARIQKYKDAIHNQ